MKVNFYIAEHVHGNLRQLKSELPKFSYDSSALLDVKKWSPLLRHEIIRVPENYVPLSELAETRKGTVTGSDKYFHVSMKTAVENQLEQFLKPCISKMTQYVSFSDDDFVSLAEKNKPCYLVSFPKDMSPNFQYIQRGVAAGEDRKYINSHRKPWFSISHVTPAPILTSTFIRKAPRFVRNLTNCLNLTGFHGIFPKTPCPAFIDTLSVCLNAPLPQQLMRNQMRSYGNGLFKFEPSDLLDIMVPDLRHVSAPAIALVSSRLRTWNGADYSGFPWNEIEDILGIKITT